MKTLKKVHVRGYSLNNIEKNIRNRLEYALNLIIFIIKL